ncbi:hypothetical protein ONZ45_g16493 [Pleurotus djamor]|nr:hypothetical protein ONZ45_g16493 [Pleurotus djamor]
MTDSTGLLFVYSELGDPAAEKQFNDWYDNKTIPAHASIPGVHTLARYRSVDGKQPSWLALYDLASVDAIESPVFREPSATASEDDRNIVTNLSMFNQRVYTYRSTLSSAAKLTSTLPGKYLLVALLHPSSQGEGNFNKWYDEEHMGMIAKLPGWIRGRRFTLVSSAELARTPGPSNNDLANPNLKYLAVHDLEQPVDLGSATFQAALATDWTKKVMEDVRSNVELRLFELHKDFKPTSYHVRWWLTPKVLMTSFVGVIAIVLMTDVFGITNNFLDKPTSHMPQSPSYIALVFGEPGDLVTEDQFNDWYDNTHIPDIFTEPGVLSAARFRAADEKKPSWATLYDLTSPGVLQSKDLKKIVPSEAQKFVTANASMLNIRIATLKLSRSSPDTPLTSRSNFILFGLVQPSAAKEAEFLSWYEEEHMDAVARTPGWVRGRVYEVIVGPHETAGNPNPNVTTKALKYLVIHEVSSIEHLSALNDTVKTPRGLEIHEDIGDSMERRVFKLYRDFPKHTI